MENCSRKTCSLVLIMSIAKGHAFHSCTAAQYPSDAMDQNAFADRRLMQTEVAADLEGRKRGGHKPMSNRHYAGG